MRQIEAEGKGADEEEDGEPAIENGWCTGGRRWSQKRASTDFLADRFFPLKNVS